MIDAPPVSPLLWVFFTNFQSPHLAEFIKYHYKKILLNISFQWHFSINDCKVLNILVIDRIIMKVLIYTFVTVGSTLEKTEVHKNWMMFDSIKLDNRNKFVIWKWPRITSRINNMMTYNTLVHFKNILKLPTTETFNNTLHRTRQ